MQLRIADKKLKRALEDDRECRKRFGLAMAKKIRLRMDALSAADSLGDFWPPYSGPERCHELDADLAGTFSMDVKQPYRLLFKPVEVAATESKGQQGTENGKEHWLAIRSVEILSIEDTHG